MKKMNGSKLFQRMILFVEMQHVLYKDDILDYEKGRESINILISC